MRHFLKAVPAALALFLIISCNLFSGTATPLAEVTTTAAFPPTALPPTATTSTPAPTVTPAVPSPTTAPAVTPLPAGLNPSGPYVLYKGPAGVWISNPDGSFLTRLSPIGFQGDLHRAVSPNSDRLAFVSRNDQGLDLVMVTIPGGQMETITQLISLTQEEANNATSAKSIASYAIDAGDSLAWQPGSGQYLAFAGAMNGPTADLYLYDTLTQKIIQLTDGPSQALSPQWSPDGRYILHFGVSWVPPFGGAIVGPNRLDGAWALAVPDGKLISLPKPKGTRSNFIGWLDSTHYLTYDSDETCSATRLRSVEIPTGKTAPVMQHSFYSQIARSPLNGNLLFSSTAGCPDSLGDGIFLLPSGQTTPLKLLDQKAYEVDWLPESQVFNAYPEALFSADGAAKYDPPVYDASFQPAISKLGYQAWEVIENRVGRVEVSTSPGHWQSLPTGHLRELLWDPVEGNTLLIVLDDGSLMAAKAPTFAVEPRGKMDAGVDQAIWLP